MRPSPGAVKAVFATVPATHPLTNLFSSVQAFCLAFIVSSVVPAHGQTPRPASAPRTQAQSQLNDAAPDKARAINLKVNAAKTRFRLPQGVTSFVIPLSTPGQRRCFTLENENIAAQGILSIATASKRLAVNDSKWNVVAGAVRFQQKREFYLSLVGVDAKFVKLTFQIDRPGKAAQLE